MNLTEEEKGFILGMRADRRKMAQRQPVLDILKTALNFEMWQLRYDGDATYLAFCEDFNYGDDSVAVYMLVMEVIDFIQKKI